MIEWNCVGIEALIGVDAADTDPIPVTFQSGYLTIKGYDERFDTYILAI